MLFSKLCEVGHEDVVPVTTSSDGVDSCQKLQWQDLIIPQKFSLEEEQNAFAWITQCIGYMPEPFAYLPQLGFILTLISNEQNGLITPEAFMKEINFHMKLIRNSDIIKSGWLIEKRYGPRQEKYYNAVLPQYKYLARQRLTAFLGFAPDLNYSFEAEVILRQIFEGTKNHVHYGAADFKAATIVHFRKAYFLESFEVAEASELVALRYFEKEFNVEMHLKRRPLN